MGHAYSNQIGSVSLYLSRCLCLVSGLVVSTEQSGRLSGIGVGRGDAGFGGVCPVRALCCNTPLWPLTLCSRETTWARCGQSAGHASPGYLLFFLLPFTLLYQFVWYQPCVISLIFLPFCTQYPGRWLMGQSCPPDQDPSITPLYP
jgi:hypothetical protein